MVKVPERCLVCGAEYWGGHQVPSKPMKEGLRVFYECGASMSIKKVLADGVYQILFKNCQNEEKHQQGEAVKRNTAADPELGME